MPQKSLRASSQATAMPNGSDTKVATSAMRSDSSTAVHSSGVRLNTGGAASPPLQGEGGERSEAGWVVLDAQITATRRPSAATSPLAGGA